MEARNPLTIRFPAGLLEKARGVKLERESLNDLVVNAVEREIRRRQGLQAFEGVLRVREQLEQRAGPQPDSTPMIRSLREGSGRRA